MAQQQSKGNTKKRRVNSVRMQKFATYRAKTVCSLCGQAFKSPPKMRKHREEKHGK